MHTKKISELLSEVTCGIHVLLNGELISQGSGVLISPHGHILTAAHVLTGRYPIEEKDIHEPGLNIFARPNRLGFEEYQIIYFSPRMESEYLKDPINIDIAILAPFKKRPSAKWLKLEKGKLDVGTKILMSGYPDEIETPFEFSKHLNYEHPEIKDHQGVVKYHLKNMIQLLIVKSGMISNVTSYNFGGQDNVKLEGQIFYIDNGMHSGASGGPVTDLNGTLLGIITQRAITSVSYTDSVGLSIPSGSTVALTPNVIYDFIAHLLNAT